MVFALDDATEEEWHSFHATLGGAAHALNPTLRTLNDTTPIVLV
jgi:hypothetical protein